MTDKKVQGSKAPLPAPSTGGPFEITQTSNQPNENFSRFTTNTEVDLRIKAHSDNITKTILTWLLIGFGAWFVGAMCGMMWTINSDLNKLVGTQTANDHFLDLQKNIEAEKYTKAKEDLNRLLCLQNKAVTQKAECYK